LFPAALLRRRSTQTAWRRLTSFHEQAPTAAMSDGTDEFHWFNLPSLPQRNSLAAQFVSEQRAYSEQIMPMRVVNLTRQTELGSAVEVADSGPRRSKGLLGRKGLEPGGGLWIVPCEAVHTFWMQFPIDLIYLDRTLRIRKLKSNVSPWRLSGCLSAHSVLELPSGTIRGSQTQVGDRVEISEAPMEVEPK
jgi:uncharacterized membrane protein (UPF0127 family)